MAWQKVCRRPCGIERGTIGRGEDDAGSSDGGADRSGAGDAHADGAGGLVSSSGDYGSSDSQAGGFGAGGGNFSAHLRRFEERGKQTGIDAGLAEHFRRPAAVGHVEKKSSRGVGHVDGSFSGEAEADVILGQHDVRDAGPVLRLVLAHPEKFGEREIREWRIAGELDQGVAAE